MTDDERVFVAKYGANNADEYIEAFGVQSWAQDIVRGAWSSFSKAYNIPSDKKDSVIVSNSDGYCQNCGRLRSEHYTWFQYCEGAPSTNPEIFKAKRLTEQVEVSE